MARTYTTQARRHSLPAARTIMMGGRERTAKCWCLCAFNHPDKRRVCGPARTVELRRVGNVETLLCAGCAEANGAVLAGTE